MRALHVATRLAGTDGVSLEATKVARVLARDFGFEPAYLAGERGPGATPGRTIPALHFRDPVAAALGARAFDGGAPDMELERAIEARARELARALREAVADLRPDLLVVQNAWAIPMQLPLARALAVVAAETGLPCLSHEHDYPWERERFAACRVPGFVAEHFPFDGPAVRHLCIHDDARDELRARRGLDAAVVPNVLDVDAPSPARDASNRGFRAAIGVAEDRTLFLQPTRVVPRKGIERAIDLLAARNDPRDVLVIPHDAGDEGHDYLAFLKRRAEDAGVDLRHVADRVADARGERDGRRVFALGDAYAHADFVTYPSLQEGFGNALLETIHARKPALVNRYPVYRRDIAPHGFSFVEIDGRVTPEAVRAVARLLEDDDARRRATDRNLALARAHFSLATLRERLTPVLASLGFGPVPRAEGAGG